MGSIPIGRASDFNGLGIFWVVPGAPYGIDTARALPNERPGLRRASNAGGCVTVSSGRRDLSFEQVLDRSAASRKFADAVI
jgi:hypothetical protein